MGYKNNFEDKNYIENIKQKSSELKKKIQHPEFI